MYNTRQKEVHSLLSPLFASKETKYKSPHFLSSFSALPCCYLLTHELSNPHQKKGVSLTIATHLDDPALSVKKPAVVADRLMYGRQRKCSPLCYTAGSV